MGLQKAILKKGPKKTEKGPDGGSEQILCHNCHPGFPLTIRPRLVTWYTTCRGGADSAFRRNRIFVLAGKPVGFTRRKTTCTSVVPATAAAATEQYQHYHHALPPNAPATADSCPGSSSSSRPAAAGSALRRWIESTAVASMVERGQEQWERALARWTPDKSFADALGRG